MINYIELLDFLNHAYFLADAFLFWKYINNIIKHLL